MILDEIIARRKQTLEALKKEISLAQLQRRIEEADYRHYSFLEGLRGNIGEASPKIKIIAEVKKASPSRGIICENFDYIGIAKAYEEGGASAISVLTEPHYFKGENRYLTEIKENVKLPLLRKDFIVDEWQIYEAKAIGADAILLIAAALQQEKLKAFLDKAHELGMDALVETHDEEEVKRAIAAGAKIIGVNNRNLKTFEVSLKVSERLSRLIPEDCIFVAESGVKTLEDMQFIKHTGAQAVLIGEGVVKSGNRTQRIKELLEA